MMGVRLARRYDFKNVMVESDSLTLITRLNIVVVHLAELDDVLGDIFSISSFFA